MTQDDIVARLRTELPYWRYADGKIERTVRTGSWKATLMVVVTIGHLAEAAWHHPELVVAYDSVTIHLSTHSAAAVTEKDLALAAKIDSVVGWQPGREGGPFEGTPDDPRHTYIRHAG